MFKFEVFVVTSSDLSIDGKEAEIMPFFPSGTFKTHLTGEILTGFETDLLFASQKSDGQLDL